ncbi:MAG: SDR family oxidoreductase [Dehalococcoidia bacterium]|nr:SDR family oxidoreductase [Dehalococcoidia bacterium]
MRRFEGKVALVTGGASGIGRATCLAFAREGAKVVVDDIQADAGEETVRLIRNAGGEAIFAKADVSKAPEVESLVEKAVDTYGRLDCAFNNAGVGEPLRRIHKTSEDNWDRVMATNLKGVYLCMKYELSVMLKQGKGTIVNTSSLAGIKGLSGQAAYVASKHGVLGLTKAAALEYATSGIRINAVCPGVINTPLIAPNMKERPQMEKVYVDMEPIGRLGQPEEIAAAVLWLCSEEASFVVGACFPVDGGVVAR